MLLSSAVVQQVLAFSKLPKHQGLSNRESQAAPPLFTNAVYHVDLSSLYENSRPMSRKMTTYDPGKLVKRCEDVFRFCVAHLLGLSQVSSVATGLEFPHCNGFPQYMIDFRCVVRFPSGVYAARQRAWQESCEERASFICYDQLARQYTRRRRRCPSDIFKNLMMRYTSL